MELNRIKKFKNAEYWRGYYHKNKERLAKRAKIRRNLPQVKEYQKEYQKKYRAGKDFKLYNKLYMREYRYKKQKEAKNANKGTSIISSADARL